MNPTQLSATTLTRRSLLLGGAALGGFLPYTTSWNVVAAGALIAAVPTTIAFFAFQRHFVSGLLVGANK